MDGPDSFSLDHFDGRARLFPLPNLIVFPHVMQPLHVFEDRYRQMLAASLAGDKLIAMSLLQPGWEANYDGRPAIYPVVCLCRVTTHQMLDDGKSNILLMGLHRARILQELPPDKSFREAQIEIMEDFYSPQAAGGRAAIQVRLLAEFKKALTKASEVSEQVDQLLGNELPLGVLTDIVAYTLDSNVTFKQQLLAEPNVDLRAKLLIDHFDSPDGHPAHCFPPQFSNN